MKRSQSSMEFLILVGFLFFIFIGFFILIQYNIYTKARENQEFEVKDLALNIQDEINIAYSASEGYKRLFVIPNNINGLEYNINITGNMVYIESRNRRIGLGLPIVNVIGDLKKGNNTIELLDGEVVLNSKMELSSSSFFNNKEIPLKHVCNEIVGGQEISPAFTITNIPEKTKTLLLIVEDMSTLPRYVHYIVWKIDAQGITTKNINEGDLGIGVIGTNSKDEINYYGMCPPLNDKDHKYIFTVYALNNSMEGVINTRKKDYIMDYVHDHLLDKAIIIGKYG